VYLWALDYIEIFAYPNAATTQAISTAGSYLGLELVSI
jgi:hypothetical protein